MQGAESTLLFDVGGDSKVLLENMEKLGFSPADIDTVILSHIHGDHAGGLFGFLKRNPDVTVYMPDAFLSNLTESVKKAGAVPLKVKESRKINPWAFSTGELGSFIKEQSLVIQTEKGLIIITGCAHPGITNIVSASKSMLDENTGVYMVLGGFHLCGSNESTIRQIAYNLKNQGVLKAAPCHCSGNLARKIFKDIYGKDFIPVGVGSGLELPETLLSQDNRGKNALFGQ